MEEGLLSSSIIKGEVEEVLRRLGRTSFLPRASGESRLPEPPTRRLACRGRKAGGCSGWASLGEKEESKETGGSRRDAQPCSLRGGAGVVAVWNLTPRATLAALGAEDSREGVMLPAGRVGEGPATSVRHPWWPSEVAQISTWGDCFSEVALAAGLRSWFRWPGGDGPCNLVR